MCDCSLQFLVYLIQPILPSFEIRDLVTAKALGKAVPAERAFAPQQPPPDSTRSAGVPGSPAGRVRQSGGSVAARGVR